MAIVINTNVNSLLAQNYLTENQAGLSRAMQRLSSGMRINSAEDDPAGMAIAVSMTQSSDALRQGVRNGNDGISLVQTAESAMTNISNLITQLSTLASQAANGTYSSTQLANLDTQFQALVSEVDREANNTTFNGVVLLNGTASSITLQLGTGNTSNDRLSVSLSNMTTGSAGLNIASLAVGSQSAAQSALATLGSITTVTTALAGIGASISNLDAAVANNSGVAASLDSARSRIADADYAAESSNLAKYNILNQSNIAMLAQANSSPGMVLQLLKG